MQPGTKYCPNHPGLKFPDYANECTVCNGTLFISGELKDVTTVPGVPFQTDEVAGQVKPEIVETLEEPFNPIAHAERTVERLRASIKDKMEAKKAKKEKK